LQSIFPQPIFLLRHETGIIRMTQSAENTPPPVCFHLIPNTHWDREWLYDFQETRMLLVEFMDRLLEILAAHPQYKTYLLDGQTVPIEDYLEIRPEKKDEIVRRVRERRLWIGPWYTLPEEHLVNGESLVRNLLIGHRVAEHYGGVMKVGYTPFSYGQASQMPQIYQGFGIDTILFYHGIQPSESASEFIFEGPDGSRLFASRMGSNARYNFFFSVYRPAVYGKQTLDRDYHWHEQGLPFHRCGSDHYQEHHRLLDPPQPFDRERLVELIEELKQAERSHATTRHIACMQGMDSTQPDVHEVLVLEHLASVLDKDTILHSSLPDWLAAVRNEVQEEELVVLRGERRTPRQLGTRVHLYGDVTSARVRVKQHNALAEQSLQRMAEPLAALASLVGSEYPRAYLDRAWQYLLKSHPHDTIAGTGIDAIERDVHHRLDQCCNIAASVTRRALQDLQRQIDNADIGDNQVVLTIFNPAPYRRDAVVTLVADLPCESGFGTGRYGIRDAETGAALEFQEASRAEHSAIIRHLGDATMQMRVLRVRLHVPLTDLPALGYRTLVIQPEEEFVWPDRSLATPPNTMENAYLRVAINRDGSFDLTDKRTGHTFVGLHYFADNGEAGHAWRHIPPCHDRVITSCSGAPQIERIEAGPHLVRFAVTHTMAIPRRLEEGASDPTRRLDGDGDDAGRATETHPLLVRSEFTLDEHSRGVAIRTTLTNTCEDHRLRIMFPTHLAATHSSAGEPFDVVERPIDRGPDSPWQHTWNPTHPCQRFVDVSDSRVGLAVISDGIREYEVTDDRTRTLALTLVRGFEVALTTVAWRWERHREMKGSQSLGEHEFRYFVYPHAGTWDAGQVTRQADQFLVPIEPVQAGRHAGSLPKRLSFLELTPVELLLSCLKQSEQGTQLIVRIYNPTWRDIAGHLALPSKPVSARYVNLSEAPVADGDLELCEAGVDFQVAAKKIVTIQLELIPAF
jgi:mannosylglycerate hydrolase